MGQDEAYQEAVAQYGAMLRRLARGYEADPDQQHDLLQEIHVGLWRSLGAFRGQCSLRTWTFRVAHNIASSHVARQIRSKRGLVSLDALEHTASADDPERQVDERQVLHRLAALIHGLKSPDRQVILLYLEDFDAAAIAEITGLSSPAVATKIHRIKAVLARQFHEGSRT
ncbi:MAG TPA: sigma-70 family RNA polymerase sigma factor [Rhizomicrobium sp.]|nr:sigma-70 family RNA polymerase sigma factor [Rhizomicrobium sp.]